MKKDLDSHNRSAQSALKIVELLGLTAAGGASPAATAITAGTAAAAHFFQLFGERAQTRIEKLHESVRTIGSAEQRDRVLTGEISPEDYYGLVRAAVDDDEAYKVPLYANLLVNDVLGNIPKDHRLHLLRGMRELTHEQLQLLRRILIADAHDMMTVGGTAEQVRELMVANDEGRGHNLESLQRYGFLHSENGSFKIAKLARIAGPRYFAPEELTPESIGRPKWSGRRVLIAYGFSDQLSTPALSLQKALLARTIKSDIISAAPESLRRLRPTSRVVVLMLDDRGMSKSHQEGLMRLRDRIVIEVLVTAKEPNHTESLVPDLKPVVVTKVSPNAKPNEFAELADALLSAVRSAGRESNLGAA